MHSNPYFCKKNMFKFSQEYFSLDQKILNCIENFNNSGKIFIKGSRNVIKLFQVNDQTVSIKSFKSPNLINKIIYRYFRKSKAKRSFEYASKLIELQIGTPKPVAFYENYDFIGLKDSYYACEHLENVFEFRAVELDVNYPDAEKILKQFIRFCYDMHEKGIEFLDHSPGNTLIKDNGNGEYLFYLVDLNRMKFHNNMDLKLRMKNLSRLTSKEKIVAIMSNEYANLSGENENVVFQMMWQATQDFQYRFHRKKKIKSIIKFWKK